MKEKRPLKIGIALGAGAARGWGHIGVLKGLLQMGIEPTIVCGSSAGALVGAAYATGNLNRLEAWLRKLRRWDIFRLMDTKLLGGGFIQGHRIMKVLGGPLGDVCIEDMDMPYAAVATELETGREFWMREGKLIDAVRASIAVPGLFTPMYWNESTWLVDGGLTNPVPVSVCRALGADIIIAVNVNGGLLDQFAKNMKMRQEENDKESLLTRIAEKLSKKFDFQLPALMANNDEKAHESPGMFDVVMASSNIVQDRITRSRMAGEPPDIMLTPNLAHIRLMEFDCVEEAVKAGLESVERNKDALQRLVETGKPTYITNG